jgi:hypothetical protein
MNYLKRAKAEHDSPYKSMLYAQMLPDMRILPPNLRGFALNPEGSLY